MMPYYPATDRTKLVGLFYENGFQDCADFIIQDASDPSLSDVFRHHGERQQNVEVLGADLLRQGRYDQLDKLAEDNQAALKAVLAFAYIQNNHLLLTPMAAGTPERLERVMDLVESAFGEDAVSFLNKALGSLLDSKTVQKALTENKHSYISGVRRVATRISQLLSVASAELFESIEAQAGGQTSPRPPPGPYC